VDFPEGRFTLKQLRARGVLPYTRQHVDRLVRAGKLPAPQKVYPGGRINVWDSRELEAFLRAPARNTA
jgi:hypothetical protein